MSASRSAVTPSTPSAAALSIKARQCCGGMRFDSFQNCTVVALGMPRCLATFVRPPKAAMMSEAVFMVNNYDWSVIFVNGHFVIFFRKQFS